MTYHAAKQQTAGATLGLQGEMHAALAVAMLPRVRPVDSAAGRSAPVASSAISNALQAGARPLRVRPNRAVPGPARFLHHAGEVPKQRGGCAVTVVSVSTSVGPRPAAGQ